MQIPARLGTQASAVSQAILVILAGRACLVLAGADQVGLVVSRAIQGSVEYRATAVFLASQDSLVTLLAIRASRGLLAIVRGHLASRE